MHDRQFELGGTKCGAVVFAVLAVLFIVGNYLIGSVYDKHVGDAGLLLGMTSSVLWVRCYFIKQAAMFKDAFELGRVAGHRDQSDDRPMRSVR